jgi:hypothetical protein
MFVIPGRFTNELFVCGCILVDLDVGSRNRAVENEDGRNRAVENVRWGTTCRTALGPRYPRFALEFCGTLLCGWLYDICAPVVSASATLPMQIKRLRFITSVLFNFVDQTPAIAVSCAAFTSSCFLLPTFIQTNLA